MLKKIHCLQTLIGQYDDETNDDYEGFYMNKDILDFSEYPNK